MISIVAYFFTVNEQKNIIKKLLKIVFLNLINI
jgi:hypothetical protein